MKTIERAREMRKILPQRTEQTVAYIDAHRLANEYEQAIKEERAKGRKFVTGVLECVAKDKGLQEYFNQFDWYREADQYTKGEGDG